VVVAELRNELSAEKSGERISQVTEKVLEQTVTSQTSAALSLRSVNPIVQPLVKGLAAKEFEEAFRPYNIFVTRIFSGTFEGRVVHAYYLKPLDCLIKGLWRFIQSRLDCFVCQVRDELGLKELLSKKHFFVIQEWSQSVGHEVISRVALCVTRKPWFNGSPSGDKIDRYFSGDYIEASVTSKHKEG
jgi:hypothetical protein